MMLLAYLLENARDGIEQRLLKAIPRVSRSYARVPRAELKESISFLWNGYLELLAQKKSVKLEAAFRIILRVRSSQGFSVSDMTLVLMTLPAILRQSLQDEFRKTSSNGREMFEEAMSEIEDCNARAMASWSKLIADYTDNESKKNLLDLGNARHRANLDSSKMIVFRG
jgi:hypothetical protein